MYSMLEFPRPTARQTDCLDLPSVRDPEWIAAHYGHD